jgi:two-component system KDP operon response regulator KdpE
MLTVRDSEDDKVEALDAGADDYVTKPFQTRELTARIRAAIRRFRAPETPAEMPIVNGAIMFDPVRRRVERRGVEVHLTPREFDALQYLITHAGRPVTHARLLAVLRGPGCGNERTYLRVLIGQLRKKTRRRSRRRRVRPDRQPYRIPLSRVLEVDETYIVGRAKRCGIPFPCFRWTPH